MTEHHTIDRSASDVVLIVDDMPGNLSMLHDALEESGYTVLLATSGEAALASAGQAVPDIVLLDAIMPGMDGFEVARRLKATPHTAHIPIVFMTGLTETEHLVAAFDAGGADYVTKPVRPLEVLARMAAHLQGARQARQARNALDAFGYASMTVRAEDGRVMWQTPLARGLLARYFSEGSAPGQLRVPQTVLQWLQAHAMPGAGQALSEPLVVTQAASRLELRLHAPAGPGGEEDLDWLIVMREVSDTAVIDSMVHAFGLTAREAEVLYWVVKGKTNRDIGDILGSSPATVKKQLEHVFVKLGVETRTAAAGVALRRIRALQPPFGA
jgi:CheY-like chemotaxis protein/DNA-binding CsgD family transcriptional regulator